MKHFLSFFIILFSSCFISFSQGTWIDYTRVYAYSLIVENNAYWVGTEFGVEKRNLNGSLISLYTTSNGLADNYVISSATDSQGNKWFGTNGGGVSKFDGTSWTNYNTSNGLADNYVFAIAVDQQGNKWFATNNGVSKLNATTFT